jgi:hypothetical protein
MKFYKQISIVIALSVTAAASVSYAMWGYAFARPDIPSAARDVIQVKSVSIVSNWLPENSGLLGRDSSWQGRLTLSRNHPYDIPEGRVLVAWQELGLLSNDLSELPIETADQVLDAVKDFFPEGDKEYKLTSANRSAVVALFDGEMGEDLIFVAIRAGQHRNDHFAYREFVLKRKENGYQILQRCSFQFDVAGIEGIEFPHLFVIFFVLLFLLVGFLNVVLFVCLRALRIRKT